MKVEIRGETIVGEIEIEATPEKVFDAFTEPEQLASWWGSAETYRTFNWNIDLRADGRWSCETRNATGGQMTVHGHYIEVDRPRKLSYTWNPSWESGEETEVHMTFESIPHGTMVRIVHSGFARREASQKGHAQGWPSVLGWLRRHFEEN